MTERFGCRHPFASAGMAFAGGTADLALGVCAGGGIGSRPTLLALIASIAVRT
jgi:NAD(P)H-dependent flavin oxidoreductase YrpB (nitropropane dioxygenase family)